MKIVIKLDKRLYKYAKHHTLTSAEIDEICDVIANGTPLPEGVEILTKDAYSDLCRRAADVPENARKRTKTHACVCINRQAAEEKLKKVVDEMALIFADIREKNVDDSVCGLCEYDCDHGIDGCANECPGFEKDDCFKLKEEYQKEWTDLSDIPSVEHERKTGKWIRGKYWNVGIGMGEQYGYFYKCSECGKEVKGGYTECTDRFCKSCGAKMEVNR